MTTNTDQLRRDIESTRGDLTSDVAMLTEKVNPQQIARRRVNKVRGAWYNLRDKVMGSAHELGEAGRETASSAARQVSSTVSSAGEVAGAARQMPRQQVQGSPLAAGLVAFGVGVLASSLLPRSRRERYLAGRVKDEASEQTGRLGQQAMQAGQHVAKDMNKPVRHAAMESAKSAAHAASEVWDEGRAAVQDVRGQAGEMKETAKRY
jgi:methyl-accepting chemotaxis protein